MKKLIEDLASSNADRAETALKRLIARSDPACVRLLLPLALSPDIQVESRAVMVLSHFIPTQHSAIWSYMSPRLLHGDRTTRLKVLLALEDLPVAEAAPPLKRIALRPSDADLRAGAVGCLSSIARIHPKLRPGLRGIFLKAAKSRTAHLRFAGLLSLNELKDSRYDQILLSARNDSDPGIRACFPNYAHAVAARKRQGASKKRRS